jgi:4-azaleucine resistance transporter AzlC
MSQARRSFLHGLRDMLPLLVGVFPFGVIYGLLARSAGLSVAQSQLMSALVFAGSAQFVAAELFASGTSGVIIVLTTLTLNLRHMLYGASFGPIVRRWSGGWKALLAFLLTDEAYAVMITQVTRQPDMPHMRWYCLAAGLGLFVPWQIATALGIFAEARIPNPEALGLDFTLIVTFIGLMVPTLVDRPGVLAALAAGTVAVLLVGLPHNLGLIAAALVGVAAGMVAESVFPVADSEQQTEDVA